jgi:PhoH-like ATPase
MKKKDDSYTGVKVLELSRTFIDQLYAQGRIEIPDKRFVWYPNQYVYLKSNDTSDRAGAITRVSANKQELLLIRDKEIHASRIRPKNKEQTMALCGLLDDDIKLCTLTGRAGTGKTLLTIAAALQKMDERKYERIIITRPMSQVGKYELGALPGDVDEKFGPYLENYVSNIQQLGGNNKGTARDIIQMYKMEAMPMQLIRGASWVNAFIIADEVQVCDKHEMLTLGTRVGEGSKLVIMGDLGQRDEDIAREDTGLYHIINSKKMKESPLTSHIQLLKSERSALSELFADTFEEADAH